jgi:hypothetical protein
MGACLALLAASAPANAYPTVKSKPEIAKLRTVLEARTITCPKVVTAWLISDPTKRAEIQAWKVACSTGREYAIWQIHDEREPTVVTWEWFVEHNP